MITVKGNQYVGWQEAFIRACNSMKQEKTYSRKFAPTGQINAKTQKRCPICGSDEYYIGEHLEFEHPSQTVNAGFCGKCDHFEFGIAPYDLQRALEIMKQRFIHAQPKETLPNPDNKEPCPICGAATATFHKELGGIDFNDNHWTVCTNRYCTWTGKNHKVHETEPNEPKKSVIIEPIKH
jgi:hypothetical protein